MANKSTATRIKDLTNYVGDVALFELSKGIKKGKDIHKHVVIARAKPRSGLFNTNVWLADEEGKLLSTVPVKTLVTSDMIDALSQLGYKLA